MIPALKVAIDEADVMPRLEAIVREGRFEHGPLVDEFERLLGDRIGNPNVVAVNANTSGLQLALRMAIPPGESADGEVVTTPLTFEATNWTILAEGLTPRWVDIDPATLNADLDDLATKLNEKTRAVVVTHWMGYPVDLDRLRAIMDDFEIRVGFRPPVIEDCAHAWGATYRGQPLGNHGNFAVFSFQAIKHLTAGSGGLIVLPDAASAERAKRLRWFGIDRSSADRVHAEYDVAEWGYRFQMSELSAAIGLASLQTVEDRLRLHRANAAFYDRLLTDVPGLTLTARDPDREPSYWMYPILVDGRRDFMAALARDGIDSTVLSRRNDLHTCVSDFSQTLPNLDSIADRLVHIPVGWWVSRSEREHIVTRIRSGWT